MEPQTPYTVSYTHLDVYKRQDYMFLPSVRKVVEKHYKSSKLFVIEKCGHVVNVEQSTIFNNQVIAFIQKN